MKRHHVVLLANGIMGWILAFASNLLLDKVIPDSGTIRAIVLIVYILVLIGACFCTTRITEYLYDKFHNRRNKR